MKRRKMETMMTALVLASALQAGAALAQDPAVQPRTGDATRVWLELQTSGNAAVGAPRPMPGEIADKVYKRYMDSFEHPLPEDFDREGFVSESGS